MSSAAISVEWEGLGKKFGLRWVFRELAGGIMAGEHIVIKGANGSGKSTLGKLLVGNSDSSNGGVIWKMNGVGIDIDDIPQKIAWAAPFMDVPEEMTVREVVEFHSQFRKIWEGTELLKLAISSGLESHLDSQVSSLSSGQKQRLRLVLALGTEAGLVVLDEPCSNLDAEGISWYLGELKKLVGKATVVVCSNDRPDEFLEKARVIILS
jgi:ABC-type multidrug transport system ATPase subunit